MVEVYPSTGIKTGIKTDCIFPKRLESPYMLYELSSPVKEDTDNRLKCLLGLIVKCSYLEGPGCSR